MHLDREACHRALLTRDARFDGRFFTAVRTTGIYCRPICPARTPKLENILFLPSAAAAEAAGFRPCLRCRPETSPETGAWHGTANTVTRAVALIAAGALNDAGVDALAARLGLGERQLRRLFRRHLGATPIAVAQTRRSLFAKQLITDTRLPMTEVALAAGFNSLRRFNATIRGLYGRAPGLLRRQAGRPEAPGGGVTLTLPYRPPHDWEALAGFLAARVIPGVEIVQDGLYARTIAIGGAQGVIAIRPAAGRHALTASIRFPVLTALPAIVERIRRIFDLGADPATIAAALSEDARLAPLVAARPGLRVPGAWDGFELAVRGILGQQITVAAATRLAGRLVAAHGARLAEGIAPDLPALSHVFPDPARLAEADLAATLGMPAARIAALRTVAAAAAADPRLFDPGRDLDEAVARLTALPGIGEWTAHYIAMRALREPDAFPTADIGLLRAMATATGRPTPAALLRHAEAWRPWRAYAALHLWTADAAATRRPALRLLLDHIASPIGTVLLVTEGEALRALDFEDYLPRMQRLLRLHYGACTPEEGAAPAAMRSALGAYFEGELVAIDAIPVRTGGTPFQRAVWAALRPIPPGTTTSYGRLAATLGRASASRAVGLANGANPVGIVVPCHRVVGADRQLTGYGGGLPRKAWLLAHEARHALPA